MIWVLVVGKVSYENSLDLFLVSRAFGASNITIISPGRINTEQLIKKCNKINRDWGGKVAISFSNDINKFIKSKKNYIKIYLTRYGTPIKKVEYIIKTYKNILLMLSMEEHEKRLYKIADFKISITNQPHSSEAAIAIFLHNFYNGRELAIHFENARYKIAPSGDSLHIEKIK